MVGRAATEVFWSVGFDDAELSSLRRTNEFKGWTPSKLRASLRVIIIHASIKRRQQRDLEGRQGARVKA